jgi:uncharacterized membrane protein YhaH (DUF805 family)
MGKYFTFSGRATRSEFWWFYLFSVLVNIGASIGSGAVFATTLIPFFLYLPSIISLVLFFPGLAVSARRLHDIGRSGWWFLIAITGIGVILLIIWWVQDTKEEENIYGPNPKTLDT